MVKPHFSLHDQLIDLRRGTAEPRPGARLAVAILQQAIHDLREPGVPARVRQDARVFLSSTWLGFWCDRVDMNPESLRARLL